MTLLFLFLSVLVPRSNGADVPRQSYFTPNGLSMVLDVICRKWAGILFLISVYMWISHQNHIAITSNCYKCTMQQC